MPDLSNPAVDDPTDRTPRWPRSVFDRLPAGPLDLDRLEAAMADDIDQCTLEVLRGHLDRLNAETGQDAITYFCLTANKKHS